ncbi:MAG: N-acetyltransferase [Tabrizicola sp.]|nr:N-acetyltransferase [Tabrizicola sp.]
MIRPATEADAAGIAALWNHWIRDTAVTFSSTEKTAADIAAMIGDRLRQGHVTLVAQEELLSGFASYAQFRGGAGYASCMEHTVLLAPMARGRGIGRHLLTAVESHASAQGAHQMIAAISGENPAGIAFHSAQGYARVATLADAGFKFGRFMDLVLMQKFLS